MKRAIGLALGVVLVTGTALADEYRGDVFAPGYSELDINFASSQYDSQLWQRPGRSTNLKYHDTLLILSAPSCVRLETGAPPPFTSTTDTMFFLSYSSDTSVNDWSWLDDDSGTDYLSQAYLRYDSGSGQRRVRVRTTGYDESINSQRVNIHISVMPLSECPTSGNVAFL
jgi:hypothetical protein